MSLLERTEAGTWPSLTFPEGPKATGRRILAETAGKHGEKVSDVVGDRRFRSLVLCRREVAWRIAKETKLSLVQIGVLLRKDHSSIIRAIQCHNAATNTNVRGQGVLSPERVEANRAAAERNRKPCTYAQKLRRARLAREAKERALERARR